MRKVLLFQPWNHGKFHGRRQRSNARASARVQATGPSVQVTARAERRKPAPRRGFRSSSAAMGQNFKYRTNRPAELVKMQQARQSIKACRRFFPGHTPLSIAVRGFQQGLCASESPRATGANHRRCL